MAKSKRLTSLGIERSKAKAADYWLSDDEGTRGGGRLAVRIGRSGSRLFYFRYSVDGVRKQIPLGAFSAEEAPGSLTLEQARDAARTYAALYRDPKSRDVAEHLKQIKEAEEAELRRESEEVERAKIEHAEAAKYSVEALCDWYVKHLRASGKQSAGNVQSLFNCHVKGSQWATMPAKAFTAKQATAMLRKIVETGAGRTASKVRSVLHSAYSLALKAELDPTAPADLILFGVETNPIASTAALSKFNTTRDRSLSASELGALWRKVNNDNGESMPVRALRLCLRLGGQRALQLLRVRRIEDIDLEAKTITLYDPKGRRQTPRPHVLPLTKGAIADVKFLIERAKAMESNWLFASRDAKLGSDGLSDYVKELSNEFMADETSAQPFQFSDLRRTAETMLASLGISKDIRAQVQSHGLSGVQTRHYDRYEYMAEKRKALEIWERHLEAVAKGETLAPNVHRIPRRQTA